MKVKELKDYKSNLYSTLSRDLSEFEKNFLLISGGILAFSITFIREIVAINVAEHLFLLYISWSFIIISIGLMMYTFLKSSIASDDLWEITDNFIISNKLYRDEDDLNVNQVDAIKKEVNETLYKNKKILRCIRFESVAAFIFGVVFLAIYVALNLSNENNNKQAETVPTKSSNSIIYITKHINSQLTKTLTYDKNRKILKSEGNSKANSDTQTNTFSNTETFSTTETYTKTRLHT
jgi:hypothetical protein